MAIIFHIENRYAMDGQNFTCSGGFMPRVVFFVILLLLTFPAEAGMGTSILYGAVHDHEIPIEGATVGVIGEATYTSRSVKTSERGIYIIDDLPSDEYLIRAFKKNKPYHISIRNVFLGKNKNKEVNFAMKRHKM